MKKLSVIGLLVLSLCLVATMAFAAMTHKKGVVKSVDEKAGTIVLTVDGKDMTLKADKGVDLKDVKEGAKVGAMIDGDMVKHIAPDKPKAVVGC
jgi:cbb3-type cytochrome oxidase subunit 3